MDKKWLTEELDTQPYMVDYDKVAPKLKEIDELNASIRHYFNTHDNARRVICTDAARVQRFRESAHSYLGLEDNTAIDIISVKEKTENQILKEKEDVAKVMAYQDACEMVHEAAINNEYFDDSLLIKAHVLMVAGEPDKRNIVRYRLRNASDNEILMGQGYFAPVEGSMVASRVATLFCKYNNEWATDHAIIKGAKFVSEYIRIQPHMDGNKRVALMALNFILEQSGYPDMYIDGDDRDVFLQSVKEAIVDRDVTNLSLTFAKIIYERCKAMATQIRNYRIASIEDDLNRDKNDEDQPE